MQKRFVPRADSIPGAGSSNTNPSPTAHSNTILFIVLGVSVFTLLVLIALIVAAVIRRRRRRQMLSDKNAPFGRGLMTMVKPNWWHAVNESGMNNMTVNTAVANNSTHHANDPPPPESAGDGGEFVEIEHRMSIAPLTDTTTTNPQDAMLMPDISPCVSSPTGVIADRHGNSNLDLFDVEDLLEVEEEEGEEVPLSPIPPAVTANAATGGGKKKSSWNRKSMALQGGDLSDRVVVSESIQSANAHYPFGEMAGAGGWKQMSPSTEGWDEAVGRPRTPPPTM